MNLDFVTPFANAVPNVFGTMLDTEVTVTQCSEDAGVPDGFFASVIISLTGHVVGTVVLRYPQDTALELIKRFAGIEIDTDSPDFDDALGELANMVVGAAKSAMNIPDVSISCPSVVTGGEHRVRSRSEAPHIVLGCDSSAGRFILEILLKPVPAELATVEGN